MKTLDTLNQKIDLLIQQHKKLKAEHEVLVKEYELQLKQNEKLNQELRKMQNKMDNLVLNTTVQILNDEQKQALKLQLATIIERIDSNLKLL